MEEYNETTKVSGLSIKDILEDSNQQRPNITGGCILLTNATLTSTMILMALKISVKKTKSPIAKRFLKCQAIAIKLTQIQLSSAAAHDLQVFDEYRSALNSKSRHRDIKLSIALKRATDSLLDASKLLQEVIAATHDCKAYADETVLSDLNAAYLVLEAINNGVLILAESNMSQLKA